MKADRKFAASDGFFPHRTGCSGPFLARLVLPFSIWHSWILRVMENPFAVGGNLRDQDFTLAVLICSHTRDEMCDLLNEPLGLQRETDNLALTLSGMTPEEVADDFAAFREYISAGFDLPEYWEKEAGATQRQRVPVEWCLVKCLLNNRICQTEPEAWDYPLQRAACWRAVYVDENGYADYIDEKDRESFEKLESMKNG